MNKVKEKAIEASIMKWLKNNKHWHFKVHGGQFQIVGVPDIIACINGRFVGIEVKRPEGGVVKPIQYAQIAAINESGGVSFVTTSLEETLNQLRKHNVI